MPLIKGMKSTTIWKAFFLNALAYGIPLVLETHSLDMLKLSQIAESYSKY